MLLWSLTMRKSEVITFAEFTAHSLWVYWFYSLQCLPDRPWVNGIESLFKYSVVLLVPNNCNKSIEKLGSLIDILFAFLNVEKVQWWIHLQMLNTSTVPLKVNISNQMTFKPYGNNNNECIMGLVKYLIILPCLVKLNVYASLMFADLIL